jgi:hypothetical protein
VSPFGALRAIRSGANRLRARRDEKAPWKCGNPANNAGFPHFHRANGGFLSSRKERRKDEAETEFQLTDPGHFKHHNNASVASLR